MRTPLVRIAISLELLGLLLVLGLGLLPASARAEDIAIYEVEGEAETSAADPRVAALDEAFSRAITQALGELIDADTRKASKAALNEHILGRARLWVARFSVTRDQTADGRRQLTVTVRVDRDTLRARLGELAIPLATSGGGSGAGDAARPGARPAVILLRIADGKGVRASFGARAEKDPPGLGALASALRGGGMAIRRAPASGPAPGRP